jgi:protein SCO1/2
MNCMHQFPQLAIPVALTILVSATGCRQESNSPTPPGIAQSDSSQATQQVYQVKGVIRELKPDGRTVVIKHEEIPGYMVAMTMPFKVTNSAELTGLKQGDAVSFQMTVTEDDGWISRLKKEGATTNNESPEIESFRQVRNVQPLAEGDVMPDYPFVTESGNSIKLSDFRGQALVFTFIFTRCPFPVFCPRMSENFAEVYKQLAASRSGPTNWHLLSISFDPAFDTPAVLKNYAQRYKHDPQRWSFVTGDITEIDAITEQFGLYFARQGANFDHNLRTVVIDASGRVHKIFIGNEWKAEDLKQEIEEAAQVPPEIRSSK